MKTKGNKIILTSDMAEIYYGKDWETYFTENDASSILFDEYEVYATVISNGMCNDLELESAQNLNFEKIYA
jgi:hypothetical protein